MPPKKKQHRLELVYRKPSELRDNPDNASESTPRQIEMIRKSIREFGFNSPVLVDAEGMIYCGHKRRRAAEMEGLAEIPCIDISHLPERERKVYMHADNRTAELGNWNKGKLADQLATLQELGADVEFLGFDKAEMAPVEIQEIETGTVEDEFWITVRGPLSQQAKCLARARELMGEYEGVVVEQGTVHDIW